MADGDLTTLAAVKAWLKLEVGSTSDAVLEALITAASSWIKSWLNRDLVPQTYTERYDGSGSQKLFVANYPITNVISLSVGGQVIPRITSPQSGGYYFTPLAVGLDGYSFARGRDNVLLVYEAGYNPVPADLMQACTELVAFRYREASRIGQSSKGGAGETTSYVIRDMPPSVATLLAQYKKVVPT